MNSQPTSNTPPRLSRAQIALLAVGQLVLIAAVAAASTYRLQQIEAKQQLPPLREKPREVLPRYNSEIVISDDQLKRVMTKLRPKIHGRETSLGHLDHNLRCWSAEAKFGDPAFVSGQQMQAIVTDHREYAKLYGAEEPPLLVDVPEDGGVRVREFDGLRSSPHDDHTMATLIEIGTPLDFPLVTPNRQTTVKALVEQSLRDFTLDQPEYEWSAMTYALLLNTKEWVTTEGREVNFDMLAQRIMRQQMPQGVCMGNHRLYALVLLLRVDEEESILSPEVRAEVIAYLQEQTKLLVQHQHADGFWNIDWPTSKPASSTPSEAEGDRLGDRLIATGHALEWWALAPEEVLPPRPVLAAAGQWLVKTIDELSAEQVEDYASFLSHVGRALALWRGQFPHQVELNR